MDIQQQYAGYYSNQASNVYQKHPSMHPSGQAGRSVPTPHNMNGYRIRNYTGPAAAHVSHYAPPYITNHPGNDMEDLPKTPQIPYQFDDSPSPGPIQHRSVISKQRNISNVTHSKILGLANELQGLQDKAQEIRYNAPNGHTKVHTHKTPRKMVNGDRLPQTRPMSTSPERVSSNYLYAYPPAQESPEPSPVLLGNPKTMDDLISDNDGSLDTDPEMDLPPRHIPPSLAGHKSDITESKQAPKVDRTQKSSRTPPIHSTTVQSAPDVRPQQSNSSTPPNPSRYLRESKEQETKVDEYVHYFCTGPSSLQPLRSAESQADSEILIPGNSDLYDVEPPSIQAYATRPMEYASHLPQYDDRAIRPLLERVQLDANKLDELHREYRVQYAAQTQINQNIQILNQGAAAMDPESYKSRYSALHQSAMDITKTIGRITYQVHVYFVDLKHQLESGQRLALTAEQRQIFDKFQAYCDEFAATQNHLIAAGYHQSHSAQHTPRYAHHTHTHTPRAQSYNPSPAAHYRAYPYGTHPTSPHALSYATRNIQQARTPHALPSYSKPLARRGTGKAPQSARAVSSKGGAFTFPSGRNYQMSQLASSHLERLTAGGGSRSNASSPRGNRAKKARGNDPVAIAQQGVCIGSRMSQLMTLVVPPTATTEAHCKRIERALRQLVNGINGLENADVVPYGSSMQELFIRDSDYDFCIRSHKLKLKPADAIQSIADALSKTSEFDKVHTFSRGTDDVPSMTFLDMKSGSKCDIVINNFYEIGSSRLIRAYASIDTRFRTIAVFVKYWARQRKINDPSDGTLSSYALVQMVINYLQSRRVLPTLSLMVDSQDGTSPWSHQDDYQINMMKFREFASKNKQPASELLIGFFHYFAHEFDYRNSVVSVRTGSCLAKQEKKWTQNSKRCQYWLCVEDPFDSSQNLGKSIDRTTLHNIRGEFMRAYRILCDSYKIYDVCKAYNESKS